MTVQEVTQEFVQRLLEAVNLCDNELHAAYVKRNQTLKEPNEWVVEAYKEASDEMS